MQLNLLFREKRLDIGKFCEFFWSFVKDCNINKVCNKTNCLSLGVYLRKEMDVRLSRNYRQWRIQERPPSRIPMDQ